MGPSIIADSEAPPHAIFCAVKIVFCNIIVSSKLQRYGQCLYKMNRTTERFSNDGLKSIFTAFLLNFYCTKEVVFADSTIIEGPSPN